MDSTNWLGLFSSSEDTDTDILYYSVGTNGETAPDPLSPGWLGLFSFSDDTDSEILYYSVGTGTDTAPEPVRLEIDRLLYVDKESSALVNDTGYNAYVIDPTGLTVEKHTVDIIEGRVGITGPAYTTIGDPFMVALEKGDIRGFFPATVKQP